MVQVRGRTEALSEERASASLFRFFSHRSATRLPCGDARCLFNDAAVLVDVVQPLADLDESHILVALDGGALNITVAALAVVSLAVPAVKGEDDAFGSLVEAGLEILSGDRCVTVDQVQAVSHCVRVHGIFLRKFVVFCAFR